MRDPAIDLLRTAESIVEQFGDQAPAYCAWKIVDTLECGDTTRVKTWLAIRNEVKSLLDGEAPDGPLAGSRGRSEQRRQNAQKTIGASSRNAKAPAPRRTPALTANDALPSSAKNLAPRHEADLAGLLTPPKP
jgi:hypothetical protein